jgi:hypothetical protein
MQHFLCFLPLPQGQGSFLPTFVDFAGILVSSFSTSKIVNHPHFSPAEALLRIQAS